MLHAEHIPVPQEVSDHSKEVLQAFSEKNIQNLYVTTQPNKNQIASGREYGEINQQTPTKPSTSNNNVIDNAYFQLPYQEIIAEIQHADTQMARITPTTSATLVNPHLRNTYSGPK
ncbi:hypothetical protein QE152_g13791 [Popillia japonica]|uniref:Uncharacterized protein n=1 Tax=Popillia japonica TaxID=7064 RepID=A0AAW1L8X9_POPJA